MQNSNKEKEYLLKNIKEEVLNLKSSPLYEIRTANKSYPVIGEGDHNATVMFIGEAPGAKEAATGRPFCGSAGKVLDELLKEIDFERSDAYITNILKDRPPKNRDPLDEEIDLYTPFLNRQINIIKPQIIVALGRFSAEYILKKFKKDDVIETISLMHGKVIKAQTEYGEITIIPLMHPAVAVYNPTKKGLLLKGFLTLQKEVKNIL
jgi:uracil-DNA glycosylase